MSTPEEIVRQQLIREMVNSLGYSASGIVLEKSLKEFPHVQGNVPLRRADLVYLYQGAYPLILIECKAVKLTSKVVNQVIGYNSYLRARYICIANQEERRTGWYDPALGDYRFIEGLPSYQFLLQSLT